MTSRIFLTASLASAAALTWSSAAWLVSESRHDGRRQVGGEKVKYAEDIDHIITIQVAHDGPVSLDSQRRPQH